MAELANGIDVKASTITGWENGNIKNIKSENLLKACLYLEVSPYWIMFGIASTHSFSKKYIATVS